MLTGAANGSRAVLTGLSAGGAELLAPTLAQSLYGKQPKELTVEEKANIGSLVGVFGAAVGAASGDVGDAAVGSQAAQGAVENNYYLTSNVLEKDSKVVRDTYKVLKEKITLECGGRGRSQECRQDIERIITFAQDKRFSKNYKDLQNESTRFLSEHPGLVADYLTSQYEKLSREDKSILNLYIQPGAQILGAASGIVISVKGGVASCAQTFGLGCGVATVGLVSSSDHLVTGLNNFGKPTSQRNPTITVQGLKQLGLSEEAANYVQFAIDTLSVGKTGIVISKPNQVVARNIKNTQLTNSSSSVLNKEVVRESKSATLGTRIDNQVSIVSKQNLPISVVSNFKNSEYQTVITNQSIIVYRKFGGGQNQAKLLGGYTTTISNAGRQETAVYKKWSTSQFEAQIEIPKGQIINIGKVGPQPPQSQIPKYRGGEDQILMPRNYPISWVKSIKDGKTGRVYSIKEFVKEFPSQVK